MVPSPGIHGMGTTPLPELVESLRRDGWRVYELPPGAEDKEGLIRAMASVLPMDPPLLGKRNWDALSDSLWGGLHRAGDPRVAILWTDASRWRERRPSEYGIALEILGDLVTSLGDEGTTRGNPVQLAVFVDSAERA